MALAVLGRTLESVPSTIGAKYMDALLAWQEKAVAAGNYSLGYVPGSIIHHWHGAKRNRQYQSRWRILTDNQFDPQRDIVKNMHGVWELCGQKPFLRDALSNYMHSRDEDATTVS